MPCLMAYESVGENLRKKIISDDSFLLIIYSSVLLLGWHFGFFGKIADSDTYLQLIDEINKNGWIDGLDLGFISEVSFLQIFGITGADALEFLRFSIFITTVVGLAFAYKDRNKSHLGLILFISFYGPLLSLVLIRGTPAYAFVYMAIYNLHYRKRLLSIICLIMGIVFHMSALIAMIILFFAYALNKNGVNIFENNKSLFFLLVAIVFVGASFGGLDFLIGLSGYEKYGAYTENESLSISFNHLIYYSIISLFVLMAYMNKSIYSALEANYISLFFIFTIFVFMSPVLVFRSSIFWMPVLIYRIDEWKIFKKQSNRKFATIFCIPAFFVSLISICS